MTAGYPLYDLHSDLWPLVAPLHAYEEEMQSWLELVRERLGGPSGAGDRALRVLDLGSGGGHHLYHLAEGWEGPLGGVAVDRSAAMLVRLQQLLPQFETVQADMVTLRREERFPLVTVHDSFCYLTEIHQVGALLRTVARHLQADGLALVKVDAVADDFEGPYRYLTTFEEDEREVTLTHYEWDPDRDDSWLEVVYLFLERRGGSLSSREERHRLGLFSRECLSREARAAGLSPLWLELPRWDEERPNLTLALTPTKVERDQNGKGPAP